MSQIDTKYSPPAPCSLLLTPYSLLPKNYTPLKQSASNLQASKHPKTTPTHNVCSTIYEHSALRSYKKTQKNIKIYTLYINNFY